jgi:hypothetical protein
VEPAAVNALASRPDRSPAPTGMPTLVKLLVIAAGAPLTVTVGQLLEGLVDTFAYAGVLVVVETRRDLPEFREHFIQRGCRSPGRLPHRYPRGRPGGIRWLVAAAPADPHTPSGLRGSPAGGTLRSAHGGI